MTELREEDFVPSCDVVLAATIDEEYSYRGVVLLCEHLAADAAVVGRAY